MPEGNPEVTSERIQDGMRPGNRDGNPAPPGAREQVRMTAWVRGRVQGVGFRWFTRAQALAIGGLVGGARNLRDGRVEVVAEGTRERCERLLRWLREGDTPGRVDGVTEIWDTPRGGYEDFVIR